jgi:hypothetical protein
LALLSSGFEIQLSLLLLNHNHIRDVPEMVIVVVVAGVRNITAELVFSALEIFI